MSWEVNVLNHDAPVPSISAGSIWAPSRLVNSNTISTAGENEKFIFYRGLGNFKTPFKVTSTEGTYTLENASDQTIAAAFLIRVTTGNKPQGLIKPLGALGSRSSLILDTSEIPNLDADFDHYLKTVESSMTQALVASGLYSDEARAMVNTWNKSYFRTPGTRILYIVPRAWTDRILPIHLSPAPSSLVRTLVGRVEVLSQSEEQSLSEELSTLDENSPARSSFMNGLGRFAEPKLRRIMELNPQSAIREKGTKLLQSVE